MDAAVAAELLERSAAGIDLQMLEHSEQVALRYADVLGPGLSRLATATAILGPQP
jgi:hypothetical protein